MKYAIFFQVFFDSSSDDESDDSLDDALDGSTTESSDSSSDDEDVLTILYHTHNALLENRYIKERVNHPKSTEYITDFFRHQTTDDFWCITRVNKDVFEYVVNLINPDPIFQNSSTRKQALIHWQLACTLDRLGNDGGGASADRSKVLWGIGHGTAFSYYRHCVDALCNLRNRFLTWPSPVAWQQISTDMESFGFKGVVGFVDAYGTTIPLHVKPSLHGHEYLDRKRRYSVNAQIICDNKYKIRHLLSGMPGACHDSRIFSHSPLISNHKRYFSPRQYLIGDSVYKGSPYLVPAYKRRMRDLVDDPEEPALIERFNTYLARARVVNEHTIGIFKSRWSSLYSLRVELRKQGEIVHVIKHTIACAIMHNIAIDKDPWEDEVTTLDDDWAEDGFQPEEQAKCGQTLGQRKRLQVRQDCLAYFDRVATEQ